MDKSKIQDIQLFICNEYPDFPNSYIESATYEGKELTEDQLEELNNDSSFVYEEIIRQIF